MRAMATPVHSAELPSARTRVEGGGAWTLGLACLGLSACASPNLYTTARTLPPGAFSTTVVPVEFVARPARRLKSDRVPVPLAVHARMGVAKDLEASLSLTGGATSLGARLKYNFFRSPGLDLAIAPGYQVSYNEEYGGNRDSFFAQQVGLPAIVGINLNPDVSLLLTPGAVYSRVRGAMYDGVTGLFPGEEPELPTHRFVRGLYARGGIGLHVRARQWMAIQPELTVLLPVSASDDLRAQYHAGVGLNFSNIPVLE